MGTPPLSDDDCEATLIALERNGGNVSAAALAMGLPRTTYQSRLRSARARMAVAARPPPDFSAPVLPEDVPPIDEIIRRKMRGFQHKQAAHDARKLIPININIPGPIGVAVFGDIHIDNNGCNFPLLMEHTALVKQTEGLFAGAVGDLSDSWVGRLARLWANTSLTAREAHKLVEWWISELDGKLIWITEGNHDAWAHGVNGTSPIEWIASRQGTVSDTDGVRMALRLPGGKEYVVNCRHNFTGKSIYNAAHGIARAAIFGWRDDVLIAGHTHQSAYNVIKDPMTGRVSHAVRVASYKAIDDYAKQAGFPDENVFECPVILIDPDEPDPRHRVSIEFNPTRAARTLSMLRAEWKKRSHGRVTTEHGTLNTSHGKVHRPDRS